MILAASCRSEQAEPLDLRTEAREVGSSTGDVDDEETADPATPLAVDPGCGGGWFAEVIEMSWMDLPNSADFVSPSAVDLSSDWSAEGALPTLRVFNPRNFDRAIELEVRVQGTGNPESFSIGTESIAAASHFDVVLQLPSKVMKDVAESDYSAQLVILSRDEGKPTHGGRLSSPLYVHYEDARFHVYDDEGLVARHKAGDLNGGYYDSLDASEQASLVRIARGRAEVGDPGDPSEP